MLKTFVNMLITPKLRALNAKRWSKMQHIKKYSSLSQNFYYVNCASGALHCYTGLKITSRLVRYNVQIAISFIIVGDDDCYACTGNNI